MTNNMVFIFCLRHGSSNDSIIVLSAQRSLPISIQKSFAAGNPRFVTCKDTHLDTNSLNHKDLVATVVNGNN